MAYVSFNTAVHGYSSPNTNHPYAGAARRLDEVWISPTLAYYVSGVGQGRYAGFSTHELLQVDFQFEEQAIIGKKLPKGLSQDDCAQLLKSRDDSVWLEGGPDTDDPQLLFDDWHDKFCAWLKIPPGKVGVGREKVAVDDREAKAPAKAAVMYKQNIARKAGEWRELRFLLGKDVWGPVREARVETLLLSLQKAPWDSWCGLLNVSVLEEPLGDCILQRTRRTRYWVEWADAHWDRIHLEVIRQARHALSRWKLSVRDNLSNSEFKMISRWLKAHNTLPVLRTGEGEFVSHPHLVGQQLTDAWKEFFGRGDATLSPEDVQAMVQGIEPYHADIPPLDPRDLKKHVMRTANSAPGEDAYPLVLLQAMPPPGWELLTKLFAALEEGKRWPTQLRSALVCAIPRADSGSVATPLKWRLISVTSHLYRAWGGLRAKQIGKCWLSAISPSGLFGGVPKKSAEDGAHTSSFWWDQASVMDLPLWSISMDASKCFDSIAPASIIEIATRLGAPRKPLLALANWYAVHDRRFLVKDWIQDKWTPPKGILQGCPMSVLLCATWGLIWSKHVGKLIDSPAVAVKGTTAYLDDLSISASDKSTLTIAAGWTMAFFRTWNIGVNLEKSVVLQNVQADRQTPLSRGHSR